MFQTNVNGLIGMTQEVLKIYKSRPDGGKGDIINVGSIAGREGYPGGSIYCSTKAAVRTFSDALRRELIATRIRVIVVDPGQVETVRGYRKHNSLGASRLTATTGIFGRPLLRRQVQGRRRLPGCRSSDPRRYCRGHRLHCRSPRERRHCRLAHFPQSPGKPVPHIPSRRKRGKEG